MSCQAWWSNSITQRGPKTVGPKVELPLASPLVRAKRASIGFSPVMLEMLSITHR